MNSQWQGNLPIYKQLADKIKAAILEKIYIEGEALPSVRVLSSELSINHITVSKALHELLDEGLIEMKRGLGMFVMQGAVVALQKTQKEHFLQRELPELLDKTRRLGIDTEELINWINIQREKERD